METNNRRLIVFNQVTLDGYFTGENDDISWAHHSPVSYTHLPSPRDRTRSRMPSYA